MNLNGYIRWPALTYAGFYTTCQMILRALKILVVLKLFLFAGSAYADNGNINFMNIGTKEGLSSNTINAMLKDRLGYMWFATADGLNRYDGEHFNIYRQNDAKPKGLPANLINAIYEDKNSNLWLGTENGLAMYDRRSNSFRDYSGVIKQSISSLAFDSKGRIWTASYFGLSIFNPNTTKLEELKLPNKEDAIANGPVTRVLADSQDRMWIGTQNGLYCYNPKSKRISYYVQDKSGIADNYILAISEDHKGNIWVGTNNGLSLLRAGSQKIINFRNQPGNPNSLSNNIVYTIANEPNGKIWIGTEDGLNIFDPASGQFQRLGFEGRNNNSLRGKAVKSLLIDEQGIFWAATFRGGVNKFDKNLAFFNYVKSNKFDPYGLNAPVVTSFVQTDANTLFIGTDGGGLSAFHIKKGMFNHIPLAGADDERLAILAMEKVGDEVWIGTYLKGLFILNTKTGAKTQIRKGAKGEHLNGNDVFCIKKDSRGNVWVGTNGEGVDCYDAESKRFIHFSRTQKGAQFLDINGYIRAVEEDIDGNIWIATSGSGIAIYNPLTGKSKMLSKANKTLANDNITSLHRAQDGSMYIGSIGGGLTIYNPKTAKFTYLSEARGLANGVIYKILEDNAGKIWLSTNRGISSYDPDSRKFKNYFSHNGVQQSPFVTGSGIKLTDGRLFFGGTDGINYFHPSQLYTNKNVPSVILTDLKIANQSVVPGPDSQIDEDISVAKEMHLDYGQNFSLSFAALNFTSPQENRYFYKLEGFDKEWNSVGNASTAMYTNLDPGTYTFLVRATSDAGEWDSPLKSIRVTVKPPFWRTYYAYTLYFLLFAGILWTIRYLGIQKLKAKFAVEQERNRAELLLAEERREAERKHQFDQLKIKFLTNISHEFRTPISLIMGPLEQLMQQETSPERANQLDMLRRNARRLLNLVNQLLDFRNIKLKEQKLQASEGDFVAFAREVADSFKDLAERKQINFQFQSALRFYFTLFDQDKMERILFNLLSNAFKFTLKDGEVFLKIDALPNDRGLRISLSDTGIGMKQDTTEKIFERFFQNETGEEILNQGSGIGLSITKEFVRLHGGTIEVESIAGKGSVFSVNLPLRKIEDALILEEDAVFMYDETSEDIQEADGHHQSLPVVLLVEDNEDFRFYLKDNLKKYYKVVEAGNGKDGWQKVLSAHPDLVVSDISMPYVTGTQLCQKIKTDKRTCHIPVILLTALSAESDQLQGLEKGANDYMAKPFNFEILHAKITNLLALNESLKSTYSKRIKVDAPIVDIESDNEKLLNKAVLYIDENLTNSQLSVEDLSRHLGMSRGSLYTKILELTGESPVEYIRSIKLDRAAVLLEKSELNVSQISYSVGFATPNYFARAFRTRYGMLPSEYISAKRAEKTVERSK